MSIRMDCLFVLQSPERVESVVDALQGRFPALCMAIGPRPLVVFNDYGDADREPEEAESPRDALDRVSSWPGLGGLEIDVAGYVASLFLFGSLAYYVDAVSVSVLSGPYHRDAMLKGAMDAMIQDFHRGLRARRTLCGSGILSPGSRWRAIVEGVNRGVLEGDFEVDLAG